MMYLLQNITQFMNYYASYFLFVMVFGSCLLLTLFETSYCVYFSSLTDLSEHSITSISILSSVNDNHFSLYIVLFCSSVYQNVLSFVLLFLCVLATDICCFEKDFGPP